VTPVAVGLAVIVGAILPIQTGVNTLLARHVGPPCPRRSCRSRSAPSVSPSSYSSPEPRCH